MSNKNTETKAFISAEGSSSDSARQRLVISIFAVIVVILAIFAVLIVGKIVNKLNPGTPPSDKDYQEIYKDSGDAKKGQLLLVNGDSPYVFPTDMSHMVKVYDYQHNAAKNELTHINGKTTYSIANATDIYVESEALDAFSQMVLDYCGAIDISSADSASASNLEIAWGGYYAENEDVYAEDMSTYGKDFYDHALGTSLTLKYHSDHSTKVTENNLKKDFAWIAEHAHEYGFIIRYPGECETHTGFNSNTRVHLRYVGVAHATYIHEQGICFDEYISLLRSRTYTYESPLTVIAGDKTYAVYYVKSTGDPTIIKAPKGASYTISGDNSDGYIVTVEK